MKIKSLICLYIKRKFVQNPLELDENMQLNNSSIVSKTCVPKFLTRPAFKFGGLCTFNKVVVQKLELVL